ncbi:metal-dependent hydrolase [Steroidobacter agaridevorans]|uniref:Metal-dependent hydrolase n=1 Tax=Steroidobacter agaridevorans TaxID=2695856 RepID=A0A829Y8D3_9GAMM|nr:MULTISPECIES: SprT family zinc-dependent metalloprotease [Steroidobacteraceae]GFE79128.1 metal-dependent hydrolase [Steroidobacter agaridevorans]
MRNSFNYGDTEIEYSVAHNARLESKVRIHVHPNGFVEVESPPGKSASEICHAVRKRARWIAKHLEANSQLRAHALPREYVSGETHFYLGRRYQLKIVAPVADRPVVAMKAGRIHVAVRGEEPLAVRRRLNAWYKERAEDYLGRRLSEISETIPWLKNEPPLKLTAMRKQWGSCSPSGSINLNPWLIRAPRDCIDYVLIHEICHLKEHNHSKRYYELLERHCPNWRKIKTRLDGMAELLLAH